MSYTFHKDIKDDDLHVNKLHKGTHHKDGTDEIDWQLLDGLKDYIDGQISGENHWDVVGDTLFTHIPNLNINLAEGDFVTEGNITGANLSGDNTGDQDLSDLALKSNVLELDNETEFIPDSDYEPATKKYVDDHISPTETYTGTAERAVGGITDGQVFTDATMEEMWNALIKQEKFPVLTAPSSTFTASITGLRIVGDSISITFASAFSRGSINPQYTALSNYRAGLPNTYEFTGTGLVNQSKVDLFDSQVISDYIVLINGQSWQGKVAYDAGVQPKSSYDNDYDSPLSAGSTSYITRTITGVYPFFGTTVNIEALTQQALATHGSVITISMVAEDGVNKQKLETPLVWGAISKIEQYNTLSGQWDVILASTFTTTDTTETINGSVIDYKVHTHNGGSIGARQLRFTF